LKQREKDGIKVMGRQEKDVSSHWKTSRKGEDIVN
jgi:hypothetical protein